ncbi:methylmalonyl-CoA mutase subunit beta [Muriicola sp. Z0-33]|uniref:methylmalonyl-CoA mutase subunit beta n=1 Tax=Muriicola sp. Z0-33 TaxID=2816957 RepID=UPI0022389E50|nr:methylmalonyl-CoA mutase subunit beta [Muriicola sp. Z0-33]MCW5515810.1 methylmalonyl-CoA mutase subunit beta [Muriicola sp. Z0-33]
MKKTNLFEEFQDVSSKSWKQKIQFDLKGADYNKNLIWNAPEGIPIKPYYHQDDLSSSTPTPKLPEQWLVGQTIVVADTIKANLKALDALERGAESLSFTIPSSDLNIKELLQGINLEQIPIHFQFQFLSDSYIVELQKIPGLSAQNTYLNIDTIGNLGRSGNWYKSLEKDQSELSSILTAYPELNSVAVDMSLYQNAGANMVQQLAYGIAHANEYLNLINQKGISFSKLGAFNFKVSIGGNYFFEIAKIRALRILWQRLGKEYNLTKDCHITATPSLRNKTIYDYNTNLLRTTMENMAGVLGGANTINCLPYDAIYHNENEFGERIARNQLLILKHESHLDKVTNAAEGAYYIEKLTAQLAEKALTLFKNIEAGGGFLKQLKDHIIQKKIAESAERELALFNDGQNVLVGTNAYQNKRDTMKDELQLKPFVKNNPRKTLIAPIIEKRLAEELELDRLKDE